MKNIKLTLVKPLILESVKNETFQKGQIDKAVNGTSDQAAFHEQAGDEAHHERMLQRSMYTALAELKTQLVPYLTDSGAPIGDNIIETEDKVDVFELLLQVSDRFNEGLTDSLALFCSRYIEDSMLAEWYQPINSEKYDYYMRIVVKDLASIGRSFSKKAPGAPAYRYPTAITLRYPVIEDLNGLPGVITGDGEGVVTQDMLYDNPWIIGRGDQSDISYTLSGENDSMPIDDIIVRCDDACCKPALSREGRWCLHGISEGMAIVTLFSRHNDRVFAKFAVRIVK